jgi:hypothetical protein
MQEVPVTPAMRKEVGGEVGKGAVERRECDHLLACPEVMTAPESEKGRGSDQGGSS